MIDMMQQHIIPSANAAKVNKVAGLEAGVATLKKALGEIHHCDDSKKRAELARKLRLETMIEVRKVCDETEEVVPASLWTLATYKELLFIDQHTI